MNLRTAIKVYTVAVVMALTTGFSFLAAKYTLKSGDPLEALFFRFTIGFAFALVVIGIIRARKKGSNDGAAAGYEGVAVADYEGGAAAGTHAEESAGVGAATGSGDGAGTAAPAGRKKKWGLLIPGILYAGGFFGFQFFGLLYASSVEAGIIMACQPAITMLVAEFAIREKPTVLQRICVVVAIISAIFISLWGAGGLGNLDMRGIILIFLSALSMSANIVFIRWKRGEFSPVEVSFASCGVGFVVYTAVVLIRGLATGTLGSTLALVAEPSFIIAAIYLGVACTMLTTLMNSYLMVYLEAVKTSVFGCAGTVITLMAGHFILNEALSPVQVVFAAVILIAVVGTNLGKVKSEK